MEYKELRKIIDEELHYLMNQEKKMYGQSHEFNDMIRFRNRLVSRLEKEFNKAQSING